MNRQRRYSEEITDCLLAGLGIYGFFHGPSEPLVYLMEVALCAPFTGHVAIPILGRIFIPSARSALRVLLKHFR